MIVKFYKLGEIFSKRGSIKPLGQDEVELPKAQKIIRFRSEEQLKDHGERNPSTPLKPCTPQNDSPLQKIAQLGHPGIQGFWFQVVFAECTVFLKIGLFAS